MFRHHVIWDLSWQTELKMFIINKSKYLNVSAEVKKRTGGVTGQKWYESLMGSEWVWVDLDSANNFGYVTSIICLLC